MQLLFPPLRLSLYASTIYEQFGIMMTFIWYHMLIVFKTSDYPSHITRIIDCPFTQKSFNYDENGKVSLIGPKPNGLWPLNTEIYDVKPAF